MFEKPIFSYLTPFGLDTRTRAYCIDANWKYEYYTHVIFIPCNPFFCKIPAFFGQGCVTVGFKWRHSWFKEPGFPINVRYSFGFLEVWTEIFFKFFTVQWLVGEFFKIWFQERLKDCLSTYELFKIPQKSRSFLIRNPEIRSLEP